MNERLWAYRRSREVYEFDKAGRRMEAREQGLSERRNEGGYKDRAEDRTEIVHHMRQRGLSPFEIAKLTGLSFEEVSSL